VVDFPLSGILFWTSALMAGLILELGANRSSREVRIRRVFPWFLGWGLALGIGISPQVSGRACFAVLLFVLTELARRGFRGREADPLALRFLGFLILARVLGLSWFQAVCSLPLMLQGIQTRMDRNKVPEVWVSWAGTCLSAWVLARGEPVQGAGALSLILVMVLILKREAWGPALVWAWFSAVRDPDLGFAILGSGVVIFPWIQTQTGRQGSWEKILIILFLGWPLFAVHPLGMMAAGGSSDLIPPVLWILAVWACGSYWTRISPGPRAQGVWLWSGRLAVGLVLLGSGGLGPGGLN